MGTLKEVGQVSLTILETIHAAADAFPPLKGAVGGALHIAGIIQSFKASKKMWAEFAQHVQVQIACIIRMLPKESASTDNLRERLNSIKDVLDSIASKIDQFKTQSNNKVFSKFAKAPETITALRRQFDDALDEFHFAALIDISKDVKYLREVDIQGLVKQLLDKFSGIIVENITVNSSLNLLAYAEGASWKYESGCLAGTRSQLLSTIRKWIFSNDANCPPCFIVCDGAGTGKSALAHAVASICSTEGILGSSFFFDRTQAGRNTTEKLVSTIVGDLCSLDRVYATPESPHQPVIVIDALDEGANQDFLDVLWKLLPDFPTAIRVFLTTRPDPSLMPPEGFVLANVVALDIQGEQNLHDIALYSRHRLKYVAKQRRLGESWPEEGLLSSFITKAGGLFLWVFTVTQFLADVRIVQPDKKLSALLKEQQLTSRAFHAGVRMDALYASILSVCSWDDPDFVIAYQLIVGTIVTAKMPLTSVAMQSILSFSETVDVEELLPSISSILVSPLHSASPVQIIHLSFAEFVTARAHVDIDTRRFALDKAEIDRRMALLCLRIINKNLAAEAPTCRYMSQDPEETKAEAAQAIRNVSLSASLSYSCRFWPDHLCDVVGDLDVELHQCLHYFLAECFPTWLEVIVSIDTFRSTASAFARFKACLLRILKFRSNIPLTWRQEWLASRSDCAEKYSTILLDVSKWLAYDDRVEEAVDASKDAVQFSRAITPPDSEVAMSSLATSLNALSWRLAFLGNNSDALSAIEEAIQLYRQAPLSDSQTVKPKLVDALKRLAFLRLRLGHREQALAPAKEAVKLARELAAVQPQEFHPLLTRSLNTLRECLGCAGRQRDVCSVAEEIIPLYRELINNRLPANDRFLVHDQLCLVWCLSETDRQDENILANKTAVQFCRDLPLSRALEYKNYLVMSLNALCYNLDHVADYLEQPTDGPSHQEQGRLAGEEAVSLCRELAFARPATFNRSLAMCLNNLSHCLLALNRHDEALAAIMEAVQLRRELAFVQPQIFDSALTLSLHNLSLCLSAHGRTDDAILTIREAVQLRRQLARDGPTVYNPGLADSLHNLSSFLYDSGQIEDAVPPIQEATNLLQALAADLPNHFTTEFKRTLTLSVKCLSAAHGKDGEADGAREQLSTLSGVESRQHWYPPMFPMFLTL